MARQKYDDAIQTGERIRLARIEKGLSMEQLGERLTPPASKGAVSNWENGYNLPNNARLMQLSDVLSVSTVYLLYGNRTLEDWNYQGKQQFDEVFGNYDREGLHEYNKALVSQIVNETFNQINSLNILNLSKGELWLLNGILSYIETSQMVEDSKKDETEKLSLSLSTIINSTLRYNIDYIIRTEEETKEELKQNEDLLLSMPPRDLPQKIQELAKSIDPKTDI